MLDLVSAIAVALAASGVLLRIRESRSSAESAPGDGATTAYFAGRRRRRRRIAAALVVLGGLLLVGHHLSPRGHPIAFVAAWLATTIVAGVLLRWGLADYFLARRFWSEQSRRNLADIARARAELQSLQAHRRNGRAEP